MLRTSVYSFCVCGPASSFLSGVPPGAELRGSLEPYVAPPGELPACFPRQPRRWTFPQQCVRSTLCTPTSACSCLSFPHSSHPPGCQAVSRRGFGWFVYLSLATDDVEQLFTRLLAFRISSPEKCVLKPFARFSWVTCLY